MPTNEEYIKIINEILTNFANNRNGMFNISVPDDEIRETLKLIYLSSYRMISNKREKYSDTMVICPEWEKEYFKTE